MCSSTVHHLGLRHTPVEPRYRPYRLIASVRREVCPPISNAEKAMTEPTMVSVAAASDGFT